MNRLTCGLIACAAGTMALDVVGYADMALRGRRPSTMPAEMIRRIAEKLEIAPLTAPPEQADEPTKNRRSALGALSGYAVGLTIGALYGTIAPALRGASPLLKGMVVGAMAMAATDVPATLLEVTDPKQWGTSGWISDIVPHVAYGVVTVAVMDALSS